MHDSDQALFLAVHGVAARYAGQPVPTVMRALIDQLPAAPGITVEEIRRIAEEISVGRDPSGL
ncbi:hypothetical protein [Thermoactinospora rubra]|uniref:hypothetical protein n=1 Tax=Thermoactinospora rubra TaxID=1088767 RepID=UPI000A1086B1|nr:hypothetical protein [Thermoactinospora rubra]